MTPGSKRRQQLCKIRLAKRLAVDTCHMTRPGSFSLDEWIGLNDEIVALVRAGVPLEAGLASLAGELRGRPRRIAARIQLGLERGRPLAQVLSDPEVGCPALYRAVVEAGLRSGRLTTALEQLTVTARRVAEMRRTVGFALIYPLVVLLMAYGLLVFFALKIAPVLTAAIPVLDASPNVFLTRLTELGRGAGGWLALLPIVLLAVMGAWWRLSGRAAAADAAWSAWTLGWFPWARRMTAWSRAAAFAEVAGLLVEHEAPLDEALALAAATAGDRPLSRAVADLTAAIREGRPTTTARHGMPPLLAWLLGSANQRANCRGPCPMRRRAIAAGLSTRLRWRGS
jgi:general secretion pathway protein F